MWLDLRSVEEKLETKVVGRRVVYVTSTGSTQDAARAEAESEAESGTVVLAEKQAVGRGRFGRQWVSPAGKNLYTTLIMRPPAERLRSLSIITPLAVALAVESVTSLTPRIKWPNDVLLDGRKFAGILIETEVVGHEVRYALIGTGINVNFDVEDDSEIAAIATSLKGELGRETSREDLLAAYLNQFEVLYERAATGDGVLNDWRSRLDTLGRQIKVSFGGQVEDGIAEDVDANGNLILLRADGSRVAIEAGEVTLRV